MNKIKNIEFLRFIFIVLIVNFHLFTHGNTLFALYPDLYQTMRTGCTNAYIIVDMFFIIAGFFLFFTAKKNISFGNFALGRIIRLYPVPAFSVLCFYIFSCFGIVNFDPYANVLNLLILRNSGLSIELVNNGTVWFVSALFWASILYFYLIKNFKAKNVNIVIALTIYFSYVLILNTYKGSLTQHFPVIWNLFNVGILRALAGIGLGYFVGLLYEKYSLKKNEITIKNVRQSKIQYFFISFCEFFLMLFLINHLFLNKISFNNDLIFILAFLPLFWLLIIKQGFLSNLLDNNLSVFLGKFAFSIYVMQEVCFMLLNKLFWSNNASFIAMYPKFSLLISITCTVAVGVIIYYLVEKQAVKIISILREKNDKTI